MDWDDLRVLIAIAEAGSLAGAARSLHVNHSTAFRRLNALEDGLGVRLFDRFKTGYVLTPVGEQMLVQARAAEAAIHNIEFELAGQEIAAIGTVRVTCAPNIARTIVPLATRRLRDTHPGIVVDVSVGDTDYDLSRREADIALRATLNPPETLVGRRVLEMHWSVCRSAALGGPPPRRAEDLGEHPLVGADRDLQRLAVFRWLEDAFGDAIVVRSNDLSTMAALTNAGVGYSVLPSDQQAPGLERLFPVPDFRGELWLLTHPDLRNVRRVRAVWDALAGAAVDSGI